MDPQLVAQILAYWASASASSSDSARRCVGVGIMCSRFPEGAAIRLMPQLQAKVFLLLA